LLTLASDKVFCLQKQNELTWKTMMVVLEQQDMTAQQFTRLEDMRMAATDDLRWAIFDKMGDFQASAPLRRVSWHMNLIEIRCSLILPLVLEWSVASKIFSRRIP
jgi:hypothetical protein